METNMESRKQSHSDAVDEVPNDPDAGDNVDLTPKQCTRNVWGVLTAISDKAKSRPQGPQIFLHANEHVLGRLANDPSCRFDSLNVSGKHCTIFRKQFKTEAGERWLVYIKDSSSNGTFINFQKLKRDSPDARISDGDIISLVNPPEHDNAFTYLYQETKPHVEATELCQPQGTILKSYKRKNVYDDEGFGEPYLGDTKRAKGLGSNDEVSLFDFGQLQKSNENLRDQLKENLLIIEKLRSESSAVKEQHDAALKELQESLSAAFTEQIKELQIQLDKKEKELERITSLSALHNSQLEDRNRALAAAIQSLKDAERVIRSQSVCLSKLKVQLEEEKTFRNSDKVKAEAHLKETVERIESQASEVLKHHMESYAYQLKQQSETIEAFKESDKQNRSLIGALRMELEEANGSLVKAERDYHSLELCLQDVQSSLGSATKEISVKELKLQAAVIEVQNEKAVKEEALSRLAAMEVKINTAFSEISSEKKCLQDARDRITLRETQIRELFSSTSEDIAFLQKKQEQHLSLIIHILQNGSNGSMQVNDRGNVAAQTKSDCKALIKTSELAMDTRNVDGQQGILNDHVHVPNKTKSDEDDTGVQNDDQISNSNEHCQEICANFQEKELRFSIPCEAEQEHTQDMKIEDQCYVETQALENGIKMIPDTQLQSNFGSRMNKNEKQFHNKLSYNAGDTIMVETNDDLEVRGWGAAMQTQLINPDTDMIDKDLELKLGKSPCSKSALDRIQKQTHDVGDNNTQINLNAPMNTHDLITSEVAESWLFNTSASVHGDTVEAVEPCNSPDNNSSACSPDNNSSACSPYRNPDGTADDRHSDGTSPDRHSNGSPQDRCLNGISPDRLPDGRNSNGSSPNRNTNQDQHSQLISPDRNSAETDRQEYSNFETALRNRVMESAFDDEEHTLGGDEGCPVMEPDGQPLSLPLL